MAEQRQNPGRKWPRIEDDDHGERYFDQYRYTPYTTDFDFFRDPKIYQTRVARSTQDIPAGSEAGPRGYSRPDERIKEEIQGLLATNGHIDAGGIEVDVRNGVVTLSGHVNNLYEKQTAESTTKNVIGVLGIDNQLKTSRQ